MPNVVLEALVDELSRHGVLNYRVDEKHPHPRLYFAHDGQERFYVFPRSSSDHRAAENARSAIRLLIGVRRPKDPVGPHKASNNGVARETVVPPLPEQFTTFPNPLEVLDVLKQTKTEPKKVSFGDKANAAPTVEELRKLAVGQLTGYLVSVTPDLARQWLDANYDNRSIRPNHVDTLKAEINEGRWKVTHQGIAFSDKGRLVDGQHRLRAIAAGTRPVTLAVFPDLKDDVFGALDRGQRRTVVDDLMMDRRIVEPCVFLTRVMLGGTRTVPSSTETKAVVAILGPDLEVLLATAGQAVKTRTPAPIRAIWALRHHMANKSEKALLVQQWRAFVSFDVQRMDQTTAAMVRRLEDRNIKSKSGVVAEERATVGWIGFNPERRHLGRIFARSDIIEDIRAAIMEVMTQPAPAQ